MFQQAMWSLVRFLLLLLRFKSTYKTFHIFFHFEFISLFRRSMCVYLSIECVGIFSSLFASSYQSKLQARRRKIKTFYWFSSCFSVRCFRFAKQFCDGVALKQMKYQNYVIEKKNEKKMRMAEFEKNTKKLPSPEQKLCVNICEHCFDLIWKWVCDVRSACVTEIK